MQKRTPRERVRAINLSKSRRCNNKPRNDKKHVKENGNSTEALDISAVTRRLGHARTLTLQILQISDWCTRQDSNLQPFDP